MALLALSAAFAQGCYLDHGLGGPVDPVDPPVEPPPSSGPCGCADTEVCIRACWGEEMCVPRPGGRPLADGCNTDDPCRDVGVCFGRGEDGVLECDCIGGSVPTPVPVDPLPPEPVVVCGGDVCGPREVCVEHCNAFAPTCQPVVADCREDCACFGDDPCGATGEANSVCAGVSADQHVICACDAPVLSCEEAIGGTEPALCNPETFGSCWRRIEGVECCRANAYCDEDGVVQRSIDCDDSCAQSCEFVANADDCAAYGCDWFDSNGACIEPAEDIRVVTGCIPRHGLPCDPTDDSLCLPGEVCTGFAFNPCAGAECDACGGIDWQCSRPLLAY
ncbi:MAG: hypothetical protein AB8I08_08200 [Sandaracinaceae bacterium]